MENRSATDEILKLIQIEIDRIADKIFLYSQENLVRDGHIDTGTLLKSGDIIRGELNASIIYSAEHASYVEYGRTAGSMPPVEPLVAWCRRKLGMSQKEAEKTAWAIAKSIEARGIMPARYARNAIEQVIAEET